MLPKNESLSDRFHHFFYDREVPYGLAMCRICLPLVLTGWVLPRWFVCRELYSSDGSTGQLSNGYGYIDLLPEFPGGVVAALYALMLFFMLTMCIGWRTRFSALMTCILFSFFCSLDCVSSMTKYTVIASHVFLLLAVSPAGTIWSVDAWLANRKRNLDPTKPRFEYPKSEAWPRRLVQLLISIVYFGAAVTKIHTPVFFSGDQLQYWMLTHLNYQHPVGEYLAMYPILLVAAGFTTIVWEMTFLFVSWKGSMRTIMLTAGIMFHVMTAITLGLLLFPLVCYCLYFCYIDEEDMSHFAAWARRQTRRFGWLKTVQQRAVSWRDAIGNRPEWRIPGLVTFAVALPLIAFAGIELEYSWDHYGDRRPEGPHQLVAIEPERARQLLAPVMPQRDIDKFFAVDLGTFLISDLLADRRTSFRHGETMIAQCNLCPPHEDMVIECKIRDSENRSVDRIVSIATRELFRVNMQFKIADNMAPGEYSMTIETGGRYVMKKRFEVLPKAGAVAMR